MGAEHQEAKKPFWRKWWFGLIVLYILSRLVATKNDRNVSGKTDSISPKGVIAESCAKVRSLFGEQSQLSVIQKNELWAKKYKGKEFKWKLLFGDTDSGSLSTIAVQFYCLPRTSSDGLSREDMVVIYFPEKSKEKIMQFEKGKVYEMKGELNQCSGVFGYFLTADPLDRDI